jgi:hypothetical protein
VLMIMPLFASFQNQLRSLRSNARAACWCSSPLVCLPVLSSAFFLRFSLTSLRTFQRDKTLRGLASSMCALATARHEGLAEILVRYWMEGWRQTATALRHN